MKSPPPRNKIILLHCFLFIRLYHTRINITKWIMLLRTPTAKLTSGSARAIISFLIIIVIKQISYKPYKEGVC